MQPVVMYTTPWCPYCIRARQLLKSKQVPFEDIDIGGNIDMRREMIERSGRHTVPQIWVGETHVGGCNELYALERSGKLDGLLQGA